MSNYLLIIIALNSPAFDVESISSSKSQSGELICQSIWSSILRGVGQQGAKVRTAPDYFPEENKQWYLTLPFSDGKQYVVKVNSYFPVKIRYCDSMPVDTVQVRLKTEIDGFCRFVDEMFPENMPDPEMNFERYFPRYMIEQLPNY